MDKHGSDRAVADAVGVNPATVGNWRRAHDIDPAGPVGRPVPEAAVRLRGDADALRDALTEHGTDAAVADAVGVAPVTVLGWRHAHGIDAVNNNAGDHSPEARRARDNRDLFARLLAEAGSDTALADRLDVAKRRSSSGATTTVSHLPAPVSGDVDRFGSQVVGCGRRCGPAGN